MSEQLSAEEREEAVTAIETIAAEHPERYVPVSASVLQALIDERDEQEARVMQVAASADEWWGLYDQELRRADALTARLASRDARLAAVEALARRGEVLRVELLAVLHPDPSEASTDA